MKNWYAVYTKPQCEEKVAFLLTRKGFEAYCPLNLVERQWWEWKKIVYEPLFSSLVFVRIFEDELLSVRNTNDVIDFFYWLQQPVIIQDFEIEYIQHTISKHLKVMLEKVPVCLENLSNEKDNLKKTDRKGIVKLENGRLKVLLPSLGYYMVADISAQKSQPAAKLVS